MKGKMCSPLGKCSTYSRQSIVSFTSETVSREAMLIRDVYNSSGSQSDSSQGLPWVPLGGSKLTHTVTNYDRK